MEARGRPLCARRSRGGHSSSRHGRLFLATVLVLMTFCGPRQSEAKHGHLRKGDIEKLTSLAQNMNSILRRFNSGTSIPLGDRGVLTADEQAPGKRSQGLGGTFMLADALNEGRGDDGGMDYDPYFKPKPAVSRRPTMIVNETSSASNLANTSNIGSTDSAVYTNTSTSDGDNDGDMDATDGEGARSAASLGELFKNHSSSTPKSIAGLMSNDGRFGSRRIFANESGAMPPCATQNATIDDTGLLVPATHPRLSNFTSADVRDKKFPTPVTVDLNVLSWNLFVRESHAYVDAQATRVALAADALFHKVPENELDVIVFEDLTDSNLARALLLQLAKRSSGWRHHTEVRASGVVLVSRWPIVAEGYMRFEPCPSAGGSAFSTGAGVVYARVVKTQNGRAKTFHVFSTRLSSTEVASSTAAAVLTRQCQAQQLAYFISDAKIPANQPVLVVGDLSIDLFDRTNYARYDDNGKPIREIQDWAAQANVIVPTVGGPTFATSYNAKHAALVGRDGSAAAFGCGVECELNGKCECVPPLWLAYIMVESGHQQPIYASALYAVDVRVPQEVPVTLSVEAMADPDVIVKKSIDILSCHDPVLRLLRFIQ